MAEDLGLAPRGTVEALQAQMPCDAHGRLVCERCRAPARYGWVYGFGAIVLATCARTRCAPTDPRWQRVVRFVD